MFCNTLRKIKLISSDVSLSRYLFYNVNSVGNLGSFNGLFKFPDKGVISLSICMSRNYCSMVRSVTAMKYVTLYVPNKIKVRNLGTESGDSDFLQMRNNIFQFMSNSTPVEYIQNFLVTIHDYSGLPWWGSIVVSTVIIRTLVTVPLAIYQMRIIAKVELVSLELREYAEDLHGEAVEKMKEKKLSELQMKLYHRRLVKKKWNELVVRDNCHPLKTSVLLWFQIPIWLSVSIALRNLAYMLPHNDTDAQIIFMQLCVGGVLWIPNLTMPDSTVIVPVILGLINLFIIEVQVMMRMTEPTRLSKVMTNLFRGVCVLMVPIAATVPSISEAKNKATAGEYNPLQ